MLGDKTIAFIGGGNMAEALIKGLLAGGVPASLLVVAEPLHERREYLVERYGVKVHASNTEAVANSDVVILAVKPQSAPVVLQEIDSVLPAAATVISIMAGIPTSAVEAAFEGAVRVVRVMPNTPAIIMEAASAIAPGLYATPEDVSLTRRIFELVGKTWTVEEKMLDAVTGLSGSGPAYVMTFIEALADAGVKVGLPREIAAGLAIQTVYGSAKLLNESHTHPALLREKVTSPGGTTIAGLHVLENGALRGTVISAVEAACERSRELGKPKG